MGARRTFERPQSSGLLSVTATRLAINVSLFARWRHEAPARSWLPETPDGEGGPETQAESSREVDAAIRLTLERLTPAERATYLLRTAFDFPYQRIAAVLPLSVGNARQLMRRAHQRMAGETRWSVDAATHRRPVRTFLTAAQTGALGELERLLADDLVRAPSPRVPGFRAACAASSGSRPAPSAAR